MSQLKDLWSEKITDALKELATAKGLEPVSIEENLVLEKPPKSEMGDLAVPMFPFARILRMGPPVIASEISGKLDFPELGKAVVTGPYLNIFYNRQKAFEAILSEIEESGSRYGANDSLNGEKVMIEFSCPNTNKPLHLGHLRNNALGESVARIMKKSGADVCKVNLINDRGVHICKSMLAYQVLGKGSTPEEAGRKSDHFVGDYYVKYNNWAKEEEGVEEKAQQMLRDWESGDPEVHSLWERMNKWAIEGINRTYEATGISFDKVYYESETYKSGKDKILEGLEKGIFYKDEQGRTMLDLSEIGLDQKVLLRSDGTSVYITQDIGTAIARHQDFPFKRLIYVVASEQEYHFQVLFYALKKLGYDWADMLYHLSYGMVNLPEGKMKSREGTVVDADNLLEELAEGAMQEIKNKEREDHLDDPEDTARKIALAAVHYFLLQVSPKKDMIFNPAESLSFNGNTGPYLQYMTTRVSSLLRKAEEKGVRLKDLEVDYSKLDTDEDWMLLSLLGDFPKRVEQAARDYNPSLITSYLYDLAKAFSRYYHDIPVLSNEDTVQAGMRLRLASAVAVVLKNGFGLINIPVLEKM